MTKTHYTVSAGFGPFRAYRRGPWGFKGVALLMAVIIPVSTMGWWSLIIAVPAAILAGAYLMGRKVQRDQAAGRDLKAELAERRAAHAARKGH